MMEARVTIEPGSKTENESWFFEFFLVLLLAVPTLIVRGDTRSQFLVYLFGVALFVVGIFALGRGRVIEVFLGSAIFMAAICLSVRAAGLL